MVDQCSESVSHHSEPAILQSISNMERLSVRLMMHVAITFTEFLEYNRDVQRLRHYELSRICHDPSNCWQPPGHQECCTRHHLDFKMLCASHLTTPNHSKILCPTFIHHGTTKNPFQPKVLVHIEPPCRVKGESHTLHGRATRRRLVLVETDVCRSLV